jgi:DNA repair protein RadA/Sms
MSPASTKTKTEYVCENCGAKYPRWQGQCSQCGEWNTLVETLVEKPASAGLGNKRRASLYGEEEAVVISAQTVKEKQTTEALRLSTGMYEIDRVFGEGIVFGSVSLVGGQPGIGKSTILTQMVSKVLMSRNNISAIYVAGEESPTQISARIERIVGKSAKAKTMWERLWFITSTDVDMVVQQVEEKRPQLLVIDSIQTMYTSDLTGIAGSVGQIRETTSRLVALAKRLNIPTFLVGHVTKEGDIAGPKVLEHIVDTVIEVSGDRTGELRLVRSLKNRFGPTDEVGLLRLTADGVEEISNPGEVFLEEKTLGQPGSALALCMEGSRPMVVEVQALTVFSPLPNPRRVSRGINVSKLHLLLAVLQKYTKARFDNVDVFVNVVGDVDFKDPAIDLAVAGALLSAKQEKPLGEKTVYCGEIGLLGEVRKVRQLAKRVKEAKRLGYKQVVTAETINSVRELV